MHFILLLGGLLAAQPEVGEDRYGASRTAIEKALFYLDGEGAKLEKGSSCINCHHAPLRAWALREAARIKLRVDSKTLNETTDAELAKLEGLKDDYRDKQWGHSLSAYYLLGVAGDETQSLTKENADNLLNIILSEQTPEGFWKAAQQFGNQRRPNKDANQAQTMWSLLALASLPATDASTAARVRGLKWLEGTEVGTTIDARALRVVIEFKLGTQDQAAELLDKLLQTQHPDGGWGWQPDDASDAWATGLALYSLHDRADQASAAIKAGQAFLTKTQTENGSWRVEGKLTKNADMASYFGTAWAIIGLSRTLK